MVQVVRLSLGMRRHVLDDSFLGLPSGTGGPAGKRRPRSRIGGKNGR